MKHPHNNLRSDLITPKTKQYHRKFTEEISRKSVHKLTAKQANNRSILFNLGIIGIVGWSVAVPTLMGIALGIWIDKKWPSEYSWTLMMLVLGLILGCGNSWFWIQQEIRYK